MARKLALAAILFVLLSAAVSCTLVDGPDGGPTSTPFFNTPAPIQVPRPGETPAETAGRPSWEIKTPPPTAGATPQWRPPFGGTP